MGKSPGKWIKTLFFGKKASKSSKARDSTTLVNGKEALVSAKAPAADSLEKPPLFTQPVPSTTYRNGQHSELKKGTPNDGVVLEPRGKDAELQGATASVAPHNAGRIGQELAAIKLQAAFRGYLARRAFWALRGIIRLQALVRGHLVRRQVVATLHCIQGIVKFQALVRGRKARFSVVGHGVHEKFSSRKTLEDAKQSSSLGINACATRREKLWGNAFISKHVASSPTVMPLRLQYGLGEANSAWGWLELWTLSRIWEPLPRPKKVVDTKSQTRPKRNIRKVPAANLDNGLTRTSFESEKPKRGTRKLLSHPVDQVHNSPQNELEKVKRNLKKIVNTTTETADSMEAESEKPKHIHKKATALLPPDVPDMRLVESSEKKKETSVPVTEHLDAEIPSQSSTADETVDVLQDDPPAVKSSYLGSSEKDDNIHVSYGELVTKQVKSSNENQKPSKRRASFPAKQEYPENGLQNSPKLPSYMAATESAKAKLRAQGLKPGLEGVEQNGLTRRHSLPSATNGKLSSLSPRTPKLVHANGKGGAKNDRSLLSSRDGELVVQAEWRR